MVRNEFLRFLQVLKVKGASSGVGKMANLVISHLDEIQPLGTGQGKRAKKIAELAASHWNQLPGVIEDIPNGSDDSHEVIKQLKSITIGPFRGFSKEERLSLNSSLVLIYGPNGTGKSSFCEALEYGLLGSVEEAQSKRFLHGASYLKNAHVNRFVDPIIDGFNNDGEEVVVKPNEELYRYCFVEKNRIDNFSRIAAHAPAKQTELIASLFGLEGFYNFVKNFSSVLDERHLDLVGKKGLQLKEKQQELGVYQLTIQNNDEGLSEQKDSEAELANRFKVDTSFDQLVGFLGTDESPGEIQALESELQQKQLSISGLTLKALEESKTNVESIHRNLEAKRAELTNAGEGLSFKQLYSALLDLKGVSEESCPACKTPLSQVVQDPYELAKAELVKLGHLSQLEQDRDELQIDFSKAVKSIHIMVKVCVEQIDIQSAPNALNICLLDDEDDLDWAWWETLCPHNEDTASHWDLLKDQVQQLEKRDELIDRANKERVVKQTKLAGLRQFKEEVIRLQEKRKVLVDGIDKANAVIANFDEENKILIESVDTEKAVIQMNQQIAANYGDFVNMMVNYKEELPSKLVADLGDSVVALYNAFNRNDAPKDLLSVIKLPLESGQRIEISFQQDKDKFFDALHILSEGHIRCIGLAILLAKNLKTNSPLLIFDDPVNAIDDEHRSAIRETLFKDKYFSEKQIILACHGNEFFKDIHQLIGHDAAEESESYRFLPQDGENHVHVSSLKRPVNYVLRAKESFDEADYRDALMSSRRALESLSNRTWWHYGKHCHITDSPISVARRTPQAPWDLRMLVENLKTKFTKSKADIPSKKEIIDVFDVLLGISGQDPHWVYLNKGTHEESDRDEFDSTIVRTIVTSLEQLDLALS